MPRILVESGRMSGRHFDLSDRSSVRIGRGPKCFVRLSDPMASRVHCVLRFSRGRWVLKDQDSRNHTHVNDAVVRKTTLVSGDMIRVGDTLLSFLADKDPLLGETLAGCRIEERLGRGSSGTVYRGVQLSLNRPVAIKILDPQLSANEKFIRRFVREARAAARLNHPNVVQVHDAGQDGDHHYILMEYLEGGTLEDVLVREGRLPPARAVSMALQATEALAFAERQGVVHRDIKPGNLLLDADGAVKLGDLGIAIALDFPDSGSSMEVAGSPRFMAPEQTQAGKVDHRADIYSLGATLYRAIAGVPPIDGSSLREILKAKVERDPPDLRQHAPDVSPALSRVVRKMMARSPDRRYSSAKEVKKALLRVGRSFDPSKPGGKLPLHQLPVAASALVFLLLGWMVIRHSASAPDAAHKKQQNVVSGIQRDPTRTRPIKDGTESILKAIGAAGKKKHLDLEANRKLRTSADSESHKKPSAADATASTAAPETRVTQVEPSRIDPAKAQEAVARGASAWLEGRLESVRRLYYQSKSSKPPVGGDRWDDLVRELKELIAAWAEQPASEVHQVLWELLVDARTEFLRLRPPAELFHAAKVEFSKDGEIFLVYNFSSEEQLLDFVPVSTSGDVRWKKSRNNALLNGEVRFLKGNPFVNYLAVTGEVPENGFDPRAPNMNLALWTREGQSVTVETSAYGKETQGRRRRRTTQERGDYVVLGHGYSLEDDDTAFVIFSRSRSKESHWRNPLGRELKGKVRYAVRMRDDRLEWVVNGRSLKEQTGFKRTPPRSGSFTLFTNGRSVLYSRIEIRGQLNPEWLEARTRSLAERELIRFHPGIDGKKTGS